MGKAAIHIASALFAITLFALCRPAGAQGLRPYAVVGDAVPDSGTKGGATRGRALIVERSSTCILCHSGPFPEQKFQGDLAPNLVGAGSRWSEGLRLRLVDASRLNATTIMPAYYRIDGLNRVGPSRRGLALIAFVAQQSKGMPVETPAVRP